MVDLKQSYTYKVVENCAIQADVYRMPDEVVRPAILWLHGGALMFGNRATLAPDQLARYVEGGYTVITVDYRLAPEAKLEAIIGDLQDAYNWVRRSGPHLFRIDPDRIAVVGHSAGGYLTLMTGTCVQPRPERWSPFTGTGTLPGTGTAGRMLFTASSLLYQGRRLTGWWAARLSQERHLKEANSRIGTVSTSIVANGACGRKK